jgi:transposase
LAAGDLILRGFDDEEIAEITQSSLSSVRRWRKKVNENGLHGLARKAQSGRPRGLGENERQELKEMIRQKPTDYGYPTDRWTSRIVADLILKKWNVQYTSSHVRYILRSLRLSFQKPHVKSTKHSPVDVEHWRRYVWPRIKKKPTNTV